MPDKKRSKYDKKRSKYLERQGCYSERSNKERTDMNIEKDQPPIIPSHIQLTKNSEETGRQYIIRTRKELMEACDILDIKINVFLLDNGYIRYSFHIEMETLPTVQLIGLHDACVWMNGYITCHNLMIA